MALALGRTVAELLDGMSYRELMAWGDYYAAEPWGEWRADVRIGNLAALTANINRDRKMHPEGFTFRDFMLFERDEAQQQEGAGEAQGIVGPETMMWLFAKASLSEKQRKAKAA